MDSSDLIMRLFDTVTMSVNKIDSEMVLLRNAVCDMINVLKTSTDNDEVIEYIKDNTDRFGPYMTKIDTICRKCEEYDREMNVNNTNIKFIKDSIASVIKWVKLMIFVVVVTFSVMTVSYIFIEHSYEVIKSKSDDVSKEDMKLLKDIREIIGDRK